MMETSEAELMLREIENQLPNKLILLGSLLRNTAGSIDGRMALQVKECLDLFEKWARLINEKHMPLDVSKKHRALMELHDHLAEDGDDWVLDCDWMLATCEDALGLPRKGAEEKDDGV